MKSILEQSFSWLGEAIHLKHLVETKRFHHATARTVGIPLIYVYAINPKGFRGYECAAAIPDCTEVHNFLISIGHGISVGAYGRG